MPVDADQPFFLLLIGHDVDDRGSPLGAIGVLELLEENLNGLSIGSVHRNQMNAFGIL